MSSLPKKLRKNLRLNKDLKHHDLQKKNNSNLKTKKKTNKINNAKKKKRT